MLWIGPSGAANTVDMDDVVLLAHPDQARLEELAEKLDNAGIHCLTARTGSDALATAASEKRA